MPHKAPRNSQLVQPLLGTTKGKILIMLCRRRHTVAELAEAMNVTNNAIRAQIQRLVRDGFVAVSGQRRGLRRPHIEYELTAEGLTLFPRAYGPALVRIVDVLADRLSPKTSRSLLLEAG